MGVLASEESYVDGDIVKLGSFLPGKIGQVCADYVKTICITPKPALKTRANNTML